MYRSPDFSVHGIFQQEYWSGLPFPSPGALPYPGIKPMSPALEGRFFHHCTTWEAHLIWAARFLFSFIEYSLGVKCTIQWTNRIGYFDCWRIFHLKIRLQLHSSESFHFQNKVKTPKGMFTLRV